MTDTKINGTSTMQEVLEAYPSAQRALFQKYHIGGCSSCGYRPDEPLESVAKNHGIEDVSEVLAFLATSAEAESRMWISAPDAAAELKGDNPPKLLDLRTSQEHEIASIDAAQPFTQEINREIGNWPRDTAIIFLSHDGERGMDAASFFAGHGFTNVRAMQGGIDAWSQEVDPTVPRYEIELDPATRQGVLRPLNSSLQQ